MLCIDCFFFYDDANSCDVLIPLRQKALDQSLTCQLLFEVHGDYSVTEI